VTKRRILNKIGETRLALELVFPRLRNLPRLVRSNPELLEELPPQVRGLAEEFREELAKKLGVEPEDISERYVAKWASRWLKAVLSPDAWHELTKRYPELLDLAG